MSHAIWKGHISFGLVNIPVVLFSAVKSKDLHFHLLENKSLNKIKYHKINEETGKEVAWHDIVKGYEYEDGQYVVLNKEDFENASGKNYKLIEIEDFVPKDAIGYIFFDNPYYLLPDKRGEKGYVLLRETLAKTKKIGIARVMIRTKQYLAAIIAYGEALLLDIIRYDHELKKPKDFELPNKEITSYKISKKEIEIAEQLVDSMATTWNPEKYKDEYHDALIKLIDQKVKTGAGPTTKRVKSAIKQANVIDFVELLKKSIQQQKKSASSPKIKRSKKLNARKEKQNELK